MSKAVSKAPYSGQVDPAAVFAGAASYNSAHVQSVDGMPADRPTDGGRHAVARPQEPSGGFFFSFPPRRYS